MFQKEKKTMVAHSLEEPQEPQEPQEDSRCFPYVSEAAIVYETRRRAVLLLGFFFLRWCSLPLCCYLPFWCSLKNRSAVSEEQEEHQNGRFGTAPGILRESGSSASWTPKKSGSWGSSVFQKRTPERSSRVEEPLAVLQRTPERFFSEHQNGR